MYKNVKNPHKVETVGKETCFCASCIDFKACGGIICLEQVAVGKIFS